MALVISAAMSAVAAPTRNLGLCRLDTWSMRDGLPGYDITSLAQSPDGYLWLGTTAGLYRFDGVSFSGYTARNVVGLTNDTIHSMTVGADGNFYVGPEWCGFGTLRGRTFTPATVHNDKWNAVLYLHESPNRDVWVGCEGWGQCAMRERAGVVSRLKLRGAYLSGVLDEPNGSAIATVLYGGLFRIDANGVATRYITVPQLPATNFTGIARTPDGVIWCGTDSSGLFRIDGKSWKQYTTDNGLTSNTIHCLCTDHAGQLWIGTSDGIDWMDGNHFDHFGLADGLPSADIANIVEDRERNLWIAAGIYLARFANNPLVSIAPQGKMSQIASVVPASGDGVYCCCVDGLYRVGTSGSYQRCFHGNIVWATVGAKRRDFILITQQDNQHYTVEQFDPHQAAALFDGRDPGKPSHSYFLPYTPLTAYERDDGGIDVLGKLGEYQRLPQQAKNGYVVPDGSGLVQVYDEAPGPLGSLWLATDLGLMNTLAGHRVVVDCGLPKGTHVLALDGTDPQHLWIGSDLGLVRGDLVRPVTDAAGIASCYRFTVYTVRDGLPFNGIFQVLSDGAGTVWCGGYFGIFSVRESDLAAFDRQAMRSVSYQLYTAADGMRSYPFVAMPTRVPNGMLCFLGQRGPIFIDPRHMEHNNVPPPVVIEDATANGLEMDDYSPGVHQIAPGNGSVLIRYAALSYVMPEKIHFRYRLDGFDKSWVDVGNRRIAGYTNLPPGRYVFHVVACNNDGVWNTDGASITFDLRPHYYETVWFRAGQIAICVLIFGLILALRTGAITKRARELESEVAKRTTELTDANQELVAMHDSLTSYVDQLQANQAEIEAQRDELAEVTARLETQNRELLETKEILAHANLQLEALAITDGLTGLNNHRAYLLRLDDEWNRYRRYDMTFSAILLDVDLFKQYNDCFGHQAGDEVLRKVAETLQQSARTTDFVARYGGEEFIILAPETGKDEAMLLAERLRAALQAETWPNRSVTASFGVATASGGVTSSSELVRHADTALYHSKQLGRNRVTHFQETVMGKRNAA